MRYEYIEPFVNSTSMVLDSVIQSDIARGDVSVANGDALDGDIAILIRLAGDSDGNIILSMDADTALKVCSVMHSHEFTAMTPLGIDSISELANMIAGNASSVLNDMGYDFRISTPLVITRTGIKEAAQVEALRIPLYTECGTITMTVSLRTN